MSTILFYIRESLPYAWLCGFVERATYGDGFGRTHASNQDWNEAYDRGANMADSLLGDDL